ncbi:MAG: protein BatD [Kangiellaceae bacterium]|nr:protein BatD [Kangiellaceae bacterium]
MKKLNTLHYWFILFLLISISSIARAEISFNLDRSEIHENETFRLRILVENLATLKPGNNIDFIPQELQILSRQQFNNSSMINGKFTSEMGWELNILATQAGTYTLPTFKIGNEQSQPFTIRVLPATDELKGDNSNSKVKIRASVDTQDAYVQQQLMFTVRIYRSVTTRHQSLTPLQVNGALVEKLGDDRVFRMVQGNTTYTVTEQQYAIFPQQSGELFIEPMTYSATILDDSQTNNPWGLSRTKPISLSTQRYKVTVKPKPLNAEEPWLPAKNLQLEASWQPANQAFTVGAPASLDFVIKGSGLLESQLPNVQFPEVQGAKIYRDSPQYRQLINRLGINSYHMEKVAVIPSQSGSITIPEIKVPWWNTETDQQEYAILPAMTINVAPAISTTDAAPPIVTPDSQYSATVNPTQDFITPSKQPWWMWATFTFAALWLLTLIALWLKKPVQKNVSLTKPQSGSTQQHKHLNLDAIKQAAQANNPKLTRSLLLEWCNQQKHLSNITNINQLIKCCEHQQLVSALASLQDALYSSQASKNWKGSLLAENLHLLPKAPEKHKKLDKLPGLYS